MMRTTQPHLLHTTTEPANAFKYLNYLSTKMGWKQRTELEAPPTATSFPYQAQDRMAAVEALWKGVVRPSWQAFKHVSFGDKKRWSTGYIHGASGVGKTRFDLEFLDLLADYLTDQPADDEVVSLRAALKNSKTVVLDIRHNGNRIKEDEAEWPPEVILGLRLARQYWFPHVSYSDVRFAFQFHARRDPTLWHTFALRSVLLAIEQHKATPTQGDPSPRIPDVLHIAIDEIQTAFSFMVPYRGGAQRSALEPLSTGFNRALQGAISESRGLFVLGTLSGTAVRHVTEVLDPTDATTTSVLLPPLSAKPVRELVASFRFKLQVAGQPVTVSGQEWLDKGGKPFERLLATIGGNARAIECLESVLKDEGPPSGSIRLNGISDKLTTAIAKMFNIDSWGRQGYGRFGLLLALAGIPVTRESVVGFEPGTPQQQRPQPITVADLERAGIVHLRPPPLSDSDQPDRWVNTWNVKGYSVMEVPFVLAKAALDAMQNDELLVDASSLLVDFYPSAASFEKLALEHRVLRHNVASEWARREGRAYVDARDLFCGTICHPSFTKLRFVPAATVRSVLETCAAGVWWRTSSAAAKEDGAAQASTEVPPTCVTLQDGTTVELASTSPYAFLLSGSNAVDGLLNEQLISHPPNKVSADLSPSPLSPLPQ
jgi:hypothetical protein